MKSTWDSLTAPHSNPYNNRSLTPTNPVKSIKRISITLLFLLSLMIVGTSYCYAQQATYKFDLGIGAGMSGYLGDVNKTNMFQKPGFAGQLGFRYNVDTRWAVRGTFTTAGLRGNSEQFDNKFPELKNYAFSSQIYDLGARVEFNFLPYGMGETFKRLKRWTPYVAVGLGACMSASDGGTWFTMSIPMAVGVKFKLAQRLNLSAEFSMAKTIGDHLDGTLDDLQGIQSTFIKNTDWYSTILVGISYEFGKRCDTCHYKD